MQQFSFSKSEQARQQPQKDLIWKKNDSKAQKNGSHSNIYWVKVRLSFKTEAATQRGRVRKVKQVGWVTQVRR